MLEIDADRRVRRNEMLAAIQPRGLRSLRLDDRVILGQAAVVKLVCEMPGQLCQLAWQVHLQVAPDVDEALPLLDWGNDVDHPEPISDPEHPHVREATIERRGPVRRRELGWLQRRQPFVGLAWIPMELSGPNKKRKVVKL